MGLRHVRVDLVPVDHVASQEIDLLASQVIDLVGVASVAEGLEEKLDSAELEAASTRLLPSPAHSLHQGNYRGSV